MTKAVDAIAPTDVRDWQLPFTGWRGIFFSSQNCCSKVCIYHIYFVYLRQNSENYGSNSKKDNIQAGHAPEGH